MKRAVITVRQKTTTLKYRIIDSGGLYYARVIWESGKQSFFYKGLYGIPDRWEAKPMPDDVIRVVSEIFNREAPEPGFEVDIYKPVNAG